MNTALSVSVAYGIGGLADASGENSHRRLLVCTSQGYKWIEIGELSGLSTSDSVTDTPSDPLSTTVHDCPLCHIGNGLVDDVVVYHFQFDINNTSSVVIQPYNRLHFYTFDNYHSANPRAPPLA